VKTIHIATIACFAAALVLYYFSLSAATTVLSLWVAGMVFELAGFKSLTKILKRRKQAQD
jgi:hypothetical protein